MKRKIANKIVVLSVLLALVFSAVGTAPAQAAGLYTHTWFVEHTIADLRAYDIAHPDVDYSELVGILERYPADVNYGSIFPDITILFDADWSELVHDTAGARVHNYAQYLQFLMANYPDDLSSKNIDRQTSHYLEFLNSPDTDAQVPLFRAALMSVLLPNFQNTPRSVNDEKMIAFLFGLIAHQEADATWHWDLPSCDSGWSGLECAIPYKVWPFKWNEVELDNVLYYYDIRGPDGENTVAFDLFLHVKSPILAASDATGFRRPVCVWPCSDPLDWGQTELQATWASATSDPLIAYNEMKGFLETYVPGGIEYGSALTAAAWMQTWDLMDEYSPITGSSTYPVQPDGNNGWYRQQVQVTLNVTGTFLGKDTGPFTTWYSIDGGQFQEYVVPFTISTEGLHQISYYSVDSMGISEKVNDLTIKVDMTAPVVNVWTDQPQYTRIESFIVHFNGSDTVSGLASIAGEFNGQSVTDGQSVDLFWLPLGTHTLTVRAEDLAGNVTEASQSIELVASLESMKETVARLCTEGFITKNGTCNELSAKLDAALAAHNRGNDKTAVNILKAFQNAVNAQTGKSITDDAAWLLLMDSDYIIKDLSR